MSERPGKHLRLHGETAAKLRLVFDAMVTTRGVYLFDEIDALAAARGRGDDIGEARRVLNSFLQFLEEDPGPSIIVAATNLPELLDRAMLRRFDLTVLRIGTAGQSPGQAHNMQLAGIIEAHRFRDEILRRRDRLRRELAGARADHDALQLDALHAIRDRLDEIATLLRRGQDH